MANKILFKDNKIAFRDGEILFVEDPEDCSCCGGGPVTPACAHPFAGELSCCSDDNFANEAAFDAWVAAVEFDVTGPSGWSGSCALPNNAVYTVSGGTRSSAGFDTLMTWSYSTVLGCSLTLTVRFTIACNALTSLCRFSVQYRFTPSGSDQLFVWQTITNTKQLCQSLALTLPSTTQSEPFPSTIALAGTPTVSVAVH